MCRTGPVDPGCTKESCHFRDLAAEFTQVSAQRVGISADNVTRQIEFAAVDHVDYPILSDPDRSIAKLYGAKRPGPLSNKRKTSVIGTDHSIIELTGSDLNMDTHADTALRVVRARLRKGP